MRARIRAIHQLGVGPFEIESKIERLSDALVLEFLAARIDPPALCGRCTLVRQFEADDALFRDSRKIIGRRPMARGEFLAKPVSAGFEAFERDLPVAKELDADNVEIVLTEC